jgi:FAD/FMN-containing dehydrogenase
VIIQETTFGGTISALCHGAGINHPSMSDLVTEVEYVDANGELRVVKDPGLLRAAAGTLGLMGVVTAYTVRLDKMTYTAMRPHRAPVELAVPPPQEYIDAALAGDKRYEWIKELISGHDKETLAKARADFIERAEGSYYAEWFWFSLQSDVYVNTWDNTGDESKAVESPSDFEAFLEWLEEWVVEAITSWALWQILPGEVQAKLLGFLTLALFPNIQDNEPPSSLPFFNSSADGV